MHRPRLLTVGYGGPTHIVIINEYNEYKCGRQVRDK